MKRLVDVPRSELNIGDRILAKHLNDAMDDYLFTVEREQADELPTEPWTFVRLFGLDFPAAGAVAVMNDAGQWATASWAPKHELNYDRFEVLAEPTLKESSAQVAREVERRIKRVTAEAVLAEVEDFLDMAWQPGQMRVLSYDTQKALFTRVRDRFGLSS